LWRAIGSIVVVQGLAYTDLLKQDVIKGVSSLAKAACSEQHLAICPKPFCSLVADPFSQNITAATVTVTVT